MMHEDSSRKVWNHHYEREKSRLSYPDENLVRILSRISNSTNNSNPLKAVDLGAGSGRHCVLLKEYGYNVIAIDYSLQSIRIIEENISDIIAIHSESPPYPLPSDSCDLIVAWGVLHYNSDLVIYKIIEEIHRILKPGGYFVGTLRSERDSSLSKGKDSRILLEDLEGGFIRKFRLDEVKSLLEGMTDVQIGLMERTPLGKLEENISHYYFQAKIPDS